MLINAIYAREEVNLMPEKDKLMVVNINLMDEDGGYFVAFLIKSDQFRSNSIIFSFAGRPLPMFVLSLNDMANLPDRRRSSLRRIGYDDFSNSSDSYNDGYFL